MSDVKLLPCPFCGGEPKMEVLGGPGSPYRTIQCGKCKCDMHYQPTEELAIANWNARIVAEKDAEIQRLREAILKFWADQCGNRACGCDEWPECTHTMAAFELHAVAHPPQKKGASDEK